MQALWIVGAALLFAMMNVFVKNAAAHMHTMELVFYRSLLGCLLVAAIARFRARTLRTSNLSVHIHRTLFGFSALVLFFYALPHLSLSTAQALLQTSPLFLCAISCLMLRERPSRPLGAALLLSAVGMALVLRPLQEDSALAAGGGAALLAGFAAGCAYYNVRRLGRLQEGGIRTVFYFSLLCTLLSAPALLFVELSPFSAPMALWAAAVAVSATLGQFALTRGLHYGQTFVSSTLMYTSILFSGLFDYLLWRSLPDPTAWLGIALIIGSSLAAIRQTAARPR